MCFCVQLSGLIFLASLLVMACVRFKSAWILCFKKECHKIVGKYCLQDVAYGLDYKNREAFIYFRGDKRAKP